MYKLATPTGHYILLYIYFNSRFQNQFKKMKKQAEFERVFRYLDEDGDGKISASDLRRMMSLIGKEEVLMKEAEEAVEALDSDGDGFLDLKDFVRFMEGNDNVEREEEEKMKELREAFGMYDVDRSGFITPKSLKRMLSKLGESKSVDECAVMINHFDLNGDGVLSFDEFKVMMQ